MNTDIRRGTPDNGRPGKGVWLAPVLLALPVLAALAFAAVRFGPLAVKLINAAVKATVVV